MIKWTVWQFDECFEGNKWRTKIKTGLSVLSQEVKKCCAPEEQCGEMSWLIRRTFAEKELRVWGRKAVRMLTILDSITYLPRTWAKSFSHPDWGTAKKSVWQGCMTTQWNTENAALPNINKSRIYVQISWHKKGVGGKEAEFHRFYTDRFYTASQVLNTGSHRSTFLSDWEIPSVKKTKTKKQTIFTYRIVSHFMICFL